MLSHVAIFILIWFACSVSFVLGCWWTAVHQ